MLDVRVNRFMQALHNLAWVRESDLLPADAVACKALVAYDFASVLENNGVQMYAITASGRAAHRLFCPTCAVIGEEARTDQRGRVVPK